MKLDDETARLLKAVVDHFDQEDRIVRNAQLRHYRRLKLYWNNFSQIYWSEQARDYRIYAPQDLATSDTDQDFYDRPVNVFRAFLETIIAALSIQVPAIACVPDDADNADDLATAKAGDKIAELFYKHNDVLFNWLHALYIHCTEGMVAAYTYPKEDKAFGTYHEKKYEDEEVESYVCPHCQAQLEDSVMAQGLGLEPQTPPEQSNDEAIHFSEMEMDEYAPDDDDIELHSEILNQGPVCPECGAALDPELQKSKLIIPKFVGMIDKPKARICMEVMGGLYIKIANYASKQEDTPYLIWSYETHYANVLERYDNLWEKIPRGGWANAGVSDPYEQYARLNPQYRNAFPEEQVTVRETWLRPAAFNILPEEDAKKLKSKFPDGANVVMVNEIVADYENESLDDCWTLTKNPIHDYLNHDPLGELLVNIQDIVNDLISLTLQTIEHGIEQTWADPAVVNFNAQGQIEATPGYITPTKIQGGAKNISDAFFSTKAASLSPEVFQFYQIINQLGQFVSAAMPSIFGGSQESGSSRTASEYAMSRTASLQRLQTPWRMFTIWWKQIFGKVIPATMKYIKEDERFVKRDDDGNYVNVYIRKAELTGKIGSVELDASEQIPVSDEQKADIVMRLMELNNMEIMQALTSPENLPFIRKIVKMPEFRLPGEDDRQKQLEEIQELLQGEPVVIPPNPEQVMMAIQAGQIPQPEEKPSIEIDPLLDNHAIEAQICRSWAIGEAGRLAKVENPQGYKNVLLHMKQHMEMVVQQQMNQLAAPQPTGQQQQQNQKPPKNSEITDSGEANARIPIQ
jgi:hypothetical protein